MSAETPSTLSKPLRPLTRKQSHFVQELIDNPKISATEAAARSYDVANRKTAEAIATENLAKPSIKMALGEHVNLFESAIVGTVRDWQASDRPREREIALDAAKYAHDKVYGKATQRVETRSETVSINIDLTSQEPTG